MLSGVKAAALHSPSQPKDSVEIIDSKTETQYSAYLLKFRLFLFFESLISTLFHFTFSVLIFTGLQFTFYYDAGYEAWFGQTAVHT